jgi:flagellar biosynthesis anti-sigma factor FlgM
MKVTYIGKNDLKVSEKPLKPSRQPSKEPARAGEVRQDRLDLSKDVQRLLEIEKSLKGSEEGEVRAELVERLRGEIREGVYKPDSRKVADKMMVEATKRLGED